VCLSERLRQSDEQQDVRHDDGYGGPVAQSVHDDHASQRFVAAAGALKLLKVDAGERVPQQAKREVAGDGVDDRREVADAEDEVADQALTA